MSNIYNIVSELDIRNGETKRINCPSCNGHKTFTVTNNMGKLIWNCYKVSCGVSGGTRVHLTVDDIKRGFKDAENYAEEKFELPTYIVPHRGKRGVVKWCAEWGINEDDHGLMYDVKEDRVVFPVVHDGKLVDATGRTLTKRIPKWKRYGNSGLPYVSGHGKVAVVVEDCVSATIVGYGSFVGVALLGTSLSDTHRRYLAQFSTAVIALDPDALPKTLAMAKELRGHVSDVRVLRLVDDIKYRNPTDMEKLDALRRQIGE
ncbi:DNA primase [Puniceispirillum phage HMO-2011]|uniref:DNA primase n=1 Tax=Puniceispirillum phage HMO-2011 TaxID=948071 RepID=UPI000351F520|nr:DNA primase [Puniceispirillum phage HMO-2011]ADW08401.1 DNA primase [Puniceispirillum phage HMO-2011]